MKNGYRINRSGTLGKRERRRENEATKAVDKVISARFIFRVQESKNTWGWLVVVPALGQALADSSRLDYVGLSVPNMKFIFSNWFVRTARVMDRSRTY